jgi:hypothetical protein
MFQAWEVEHQRNRPLIRLVSDIKQRHLRRVSRNHKRHMRGRAARKAGEGSRLA